MEGKANHNFGYKVLGFLLLVVAIVHISTRSNAYFAYAPEPLPDDSTGRDSSKKAAEAEQPKEPLKFPISDNEQSIGVPASKGMDLQDPANVSRTVEYDAAEDKYYITEKVGNEYIRTPTYMTREEYLKYQGQQDENSYWKRRLDALTMFNKKPELPVMYREGLFDRIFGGTGIQVRPQGNVDVTVGGNWQNIKNPALTQRQQKFGVFNFDLQMNINLLATVGDKLKLNISNNTKATFDYQNMQKVEYTGKEDEIIKKIEAGNVSFPLKSTLLSGRQSLFGLKTQLQFGKLWVTSVISQQKSKQNSMTIQGGAQTQQFSIKADAYEENRNFLLGHYFRDNYNSTLKNYPVINSLVTINKIEVWITNRTGAVTGVRNILAFMDLGEQKPYNAAFTGAGTPMGLPDNNSNTLYQNLQQMPESRMQSNAISSMTRLGLRDPIDYKNVTARKLNPSEFSFNPQLGYISINTQPNPDDVIGVAYRYTYNGKVYQVGEFSEDLPPDTTNQKVIYLKLLKSTSALPSLPIWDLMMKNVYVLGGYGVSKENFRLNILYQDPGGGEKRYLPEGASEGIPLLTVLNLDRLNQQNDPAPDGVFDFVEGLTVNTQQGKIIFPVLEPFGSDLLPAIGPDPLLQRKYPYQVLYDSTKAIALQSQQNNRFVMRGSYKSTSSSEISLGGFNIPQGSVSVTAGGQRLVENQDYQIDYGLGRIKILNTGILNSGMPINIQYEDNATFGFQQQNFLGSRFDYIVNPKLTLGGTFMRLTERPFTQKTNVGDDPIKNTNLGLDASYQSEFPGLTRALDKLPLYSTTASSFITASGEVAGLFPGHSKIINGVDPGGTVYIDDFEGTRSSYDLKFPIQSWSLASTPSGARDKDGNLMFPEATSDSLEYGYNRANLNWYMLEPTLIDPITGGVPGYVKKDPDQHYIRLIQQQEIFPQISNNTMQNSLATFDLSFYPQERGPYNFDVDNIDPVTGRLMNPSKRWGGITRYIDNTDFEQSNVEFIEIWMMDPYLGNRQANSNGYLYINLGDVSEDVLKDHSMAFENGIPNPVSTLQLNATPWGYVPKFPMQITRSFDNDPSARSVQDVGYDLLTNLEEQEPGRYNNFLGRLAARIGTSAPEYLARTNDPANDDYKYFRDGSYANEYILARYKRYNGPHGNSPVTDASSGFSMAATTVPESEDINRDNTLNESENYYQYRIELKPNMTIGSNFITDISNPSQVPLPDGSKAPERWYQFKIPISEFQNKVGSIGDFRSIRFMRMYLTGFEDSTTLRFAKLQLGRNTWRRYLYSLLTPGENIPIDQTSTTFNLVSVSVEENSKRQPVPYVIPPGVTRQQQATQNSQTIQLNEQSISLQTCNLKDGDARGVFKSTGVDLRQFSNLRLFVHAESVVGQTPLNDGDLEMFLRIGSDFTNNYYEYRKPMKVTLPMPPSVMPDQNLVWPSENELDLILNDLVQIKTRRNDQGLPVYAPYQEVRADGSTIVVLGQPNIGDAKNMMLGVLNPKKDNSRPSDDGLPKCGEVWFDELRVSGINEKPAYAAAGKVNLQMADLGSVKLSGSMHTAGYGNIDQKVNQRSQQSVYTYDASSNLNLGKLMPKDWGVQLPFFIGYSENVSNPKYNPYDPDQQMNDLLNATSNASKRDSFRKATQDFTSISSFNVANARILGSSKAPNKKTRFYSIKNFDFSYSFNKQFKRNSMIESDIFTTQTFGLGYTYSFKPRSIEPFKRFIKSKSKWFSLVKDFNVNLHPSSVTFRNDMNRVMDETQVRVVGEGNYKIAPTYFKNFIWTRTYNMRWELTKSLSFDYNATNRSRVDEPTGRINTTEKRDSLLSAVAKLGRNTQFTQGFNASYTVPINKLPITDWTSLKVTYGATFNWTAASQLARNLGNTLGNTQQKQINGELNFMQLYNKNRWLRAVNTPVSQVQKKARVGEDPKDASGMKSQSAAMGGGKNPFGTMANTDAAPAVAEKKPKTKRGKKVIDTAVVPPIDISGMTDKQIDSVHKMQEARALALKKEAKEKRKKERIAARLLRKNTLPEISAGERMGGKLITMLKRVTVNYAENGGTTIPGFMDSTRYLGISSTGSPGLGYAFGYQPNMPWLEQLSKNEKLSRDSLFNGQFQQTYSQNLAIAAQVEPITDLRIDFTLNRTFTKNHSEVFRDTTYGQVPGADFTHLAPYQTGSFTQSNIGLRTMFGKSSVTSGAFLEFINNRKIISDRLGRNNPYNNGARDPNDPDYAKGYTAYSQEVLIPAFIAAYTGKDAGSVALMDYSSKNKISSNPFRFFFPLPNWRATYNGLAKLPLFKQVFNNFVITSAYTGSLAMNSFNSSLAYNDLIGVGFPSFIDSNSGNYVPYFQVPNITISDQLNPLLAIDMAFKSNLSTKFELRTNRIVSLSLIDYQVSETRTMEYVFGLGYRVKGLKLPFAIGGKRKLDNDLNIKVDVGLRNDKTTNTYLAQLQEVVSRGQRVLTISPTIDYLISQSLTLRIFYNRSQTVPYISTSFPITTTSGGVTLRFMFAQ